MPDTSPVYRPRNPQNSAHYRCIEDHFETPSILEPEADSKAYRKNWTRLIQKIYEADPLTCPKCQGQMRIISFIEDPEVIRKILEHLGLWLAKRRPQSRANGPPIEPQLDYSDCQIPPSEDCLYKQPEYPMNAYPS